MTSNDITVHFQLMKADNPEDDNEVRGYFCSECAPTIKVFNVNVHAQVEHDTLLFDIDPEERAREHDAPFHPCGIIGCTFAPHEAGPHSWQQNNTLDIIPTRELNEYDIQKVNGEV